jgi:hypothetical protein
MIVTRPLTIGEIFDRAITLAFRHCPAVLVLAALFTAGAAIENTLFFDDPRTPAGWLGYAVVEAVDDALGAVLLAILVAILAGRATSLRGGWAALGGAAGLPIGAIALWTVGEFTVSCWYEFVPRPFDGVFGLDVLGRLFEHVVPAFVELELALVLTFVVLEGTGVRQGLRTVSRSLRRTAVLALALAGVYFVADVATDLIVAFAPRAAYSAVWNVSAAIQTGVEWTLTGAVAVVAMLDLQLRSSGSDIEAELDAAERYANSTVNASPTAISPGVTTSQ